MTNFSQQEMLALLKLLEEYNAGVVNSGSSGGSGTSGSSTPAQSNSNSGPATASAAPTPSSAQLGFAGAMTNFGSVAMQSPELGGIATALNLAANLSNPNVSVESMAPSVLGALGYGPAASLASMAVNGINTSNVLGLLGSTVNPAFGLIGLANNLTGGAIGNSLGSLGNTLGNPDSMGALSDAGVSYGDQLGNALNNSQIGMDTEGMDSLSNSLSGSDSDSDSDSDSGGNADGSDGSSNQG